jgi:hypothetical protein
MAENRLTPTQTKATAITPERVPMTTDEPKKLVEAALGPWVQSMPDTAHAALATLRAVLGESE